MVIVLFLPLFSELPGDKKEIVQGMVVDGIGGEKAKVATTATMAIGIIDQNIVGTVRNSRSPVSLLAGV